MSVETWSTDMIRHLQERCNWKTFLSTRLVARKWRDASLIVYNHWYARYCRVGPTKRVIDGPHLDVLSWNASRCRFEEGSCTNSSHYLTKVVPIFPTSTVPIHLLVMKIGLRKLRSRLRRNVGYVEHRVHCMEEKQKTLAADLYMMKERLKRNREEQLANEKYADVFTDVYQKTIRRKKQKHEELSNLK